MLYAILFFLSCLLIATNFNQPLALYDEGITVYGAVRVLNGDIPYRDFWTIYSPGQFYALAGLFKLFGTSIIVERVWDTLLRALISLTIFLVAERLSSRLYAIFPWIITTLWMQYYVVHGYSVFPALLFNLLSVYLLIIFFSRQTDNIKKGPLLLLTAGLSTGFAILFKHDLGLYSLVAGLAVVPAFIFFNMTSKNNSTKSRLAEAVKVALPYPIGTACILIPVSSYFLFTVPIFDLIDELILFPVLVFPKFRLLPYPGLIPFPLPFTEGSLPLSAYIPAFIERIPFYFPFLLYLLAFIAFSRRILKKTSLDNSKLWGIALLTVIGVLSFNQASVRSDVFHIVQFYFPSAILLVALPYFFWPDTKTSRNKTFYLFIFLTALLSFTPLNRLNIKNRVIDHKLDRARFIPVTNDQADTVRWVQEHTGENEPIFIGNSRHDRIFINDVMFYFLANRPSATKYHELHPGLATSAKVQKTIVTELEVKNVGVLVLYSGFENLSEPNASGKSSGVSLLDNYIKDNFTMTKQFGGYEVWGRSGRK